MTSPWAEGGKAEAERHNARQEVAAKVVAMLANSGLATWEIISVLSALLSSLVVSRANNEAHLAICRETVLDTLREHMRPGEK